MCETMMLALEDRAESFTLGKDVTVEQVDETNRMAERLGFHISGFRSFEKAVNEESIARVREGKASGEGLASHGFGQRHPSLVWS
ncbi:MAG: hypothetical protein R2688_03450 [Fimbriimonadaceae bacterium]